MYQILSEPTKCPLDCEVKWCLKLKIAYKENFWKQIYTINFQTIDDKYYVWFQNRVV